MRISGGGLKYLTNSMCSNPVPITLPGKAWKPAEVLLAGTSEGTHKNSGGNLVKSDRVALGIAGSYSTSVLGLHQM